MYLLIISLTFVLSVGTAVLDSVICGVFSLTYAVFAPTLLMLSCALLLGLGDLIIRILPKKVWNFERKPFVASQKEIAFYEKLGIRKWKDRFVPELGATAGFSKKNLTSLSVEYLERFLTETCQGEALHLFGAVFAFAFLAFFPLRHWYFALIILFVNAFLNLLPVCIQRFNRHRLSALYKLKSRTRAKTVQAKESETTEETPEGAFN